MKWLYPDGNVHLRPFDICECGDYRRNHGHREFAPCGLFRLHKQAVYMEDVVQP